MWDSFVKNVSVLTAVATLVGGSIAFFTQRSDDIAQRALQAQAAERESKKVFLDKQSALFFEAVPLVARLAIAESPELIVEKDERRFWELFWGELGMVEDLGVARAMDLFGKSLESFHADPSGACAGHRKSISLVLSHCVRKSLGDNWGVDLSFGTDNLDQCTDTRFVELLNGCSADHVEPADPKGATRAN